MKRIIVVDDNEDILEIMRVILELEGYVVETCTNAMSLHRAVREQPALIVLDVFLQGANGSELCRQLKGDEQTKHIPIILTSAYVRAREALAESRADSFLEKPFRRDELLASVKPFV